MLTPSFIKICHVLQNPWQKWLVADHLLIRDFRPYGIIFTNMCCYRGAGLAQSVCLTTDWTTGRSGFDPRQRRGFSSSLCVQTGSGAHPASYPMGTGGPFSGGKVRQGLDADLSPPSSVEVKNEYELYLLSRQAPPWRVVGQFIFYALL
jgi:hypothetical protein